MTNLLRIIGRYGLCTALCATSGYVSAQVLVATGDTITICGPGSASLGVKVQGGVFPYDFSWNTGATQQNIAPYVANTSTFKVTVTDATGQTATATAQVNVNNLPSAQFLAPAPIICPGQSTLLKVALNGNGPFTFEYTVSDVPQSPVSGVSGPQYELPVNTPGLYRIIRIQDNGSCQGGGEGAIFVAETNLQLSSTVKDLKCFGLSGGTIITKVSGGFPPYTYNWSGPQAIGNESTPVNLVPGLYTVTVSDNKGCSVSQQFTLVQSPPIAASVQGIKPMDCLSGGNIDIGVSGGSPPYAFQWNNGFTVQNPKNVPPGSYTVTITDDVGCTATVSATVGQDVRAPMAFATVADMLTCATTSVVLDGTGSSTGANFLYRWEAEPGNVVSGLTSLKPNVNQPGTYKLIVIDQLNGCTDVASVAVSAAQNYPVANPGPDQVVNCIVKNATFDATGSSSGPNFSYHWTPPIGGVINGGLTSVNPVVTGPGTYILTVTDNNTGCSSTATAEVLEDIKAPIAKVDTPDILNCTVQAISINGSMSRPSGDSLSYFWTTTNGAIVSSPAAVSISVANEGLYTLIVTDKSNGCTASAEVMVSRDISNPKAVASTNAFLNCATPTVALDGRGTNLSGGLTYEWFAGPGGNFASGKNSLTPTVDAPAAYTLVVTNPLNNCSSAATVQVTRDVERPAASTGLPQKLSCSNLQLVLGDSAASPEPAWRYNWTASLGGNILSGATSATPLINQPGEYTLIVTDTYNKCTNIASITIARDTAPPLAVAQAFGRISCDTAAILLDGTGSSTGALFEYNWSSPNGGIVLSGANTLKPLVSKAGLYILTVANRDNGCTATATTMVTGTAGNISAMATVSGTITCTNPIVTLSALGSSTGPGISYHWGTINGWVLSGPNSAQATTNQPGQYTLIVEDALSGCSATKTISIQSDVNVPKADAGADRFFDCTNPTVTLDGSNSNQGPFLLYEWSYIGNGKFLSPTNTQMVQVGEPGNYQLLVRNTQNGCTATDNVLVIPDQKTPYAVLKSAGDLTCLRSTTALDASGSSAGAGFTYQWNGPGILPGSPDPLKRQVNQPGFYQLTIIHSTSGCKDTASVQVRENLNPPLIDIGPNQKLDCKNVERVLAVESDPNYTYLWSGPGIISGAQSSNIVVDRDGIYRVTVTNVVNGCIDVDLVTVTSNFTVPVANAGPTFQLTCFQTNYTIPATATQGANISYAWSTVGGNFISSTTLLQPIVNGSGRYYLTVTDNSNGCSAVTSVQIYQSADVPVASAGLPKTLTCLNRTQTLDGAGSGTGLGIVYHWNATPGGRILSGQSTVFPTVDKPGTYVLMVTDTFIQCSAYSSVMVDIDTVAAKLDIALPAAITCLSDTVQINAKNKTNGSFAYRWTPSNGGNILGSDTTLQILANAAGTYQLSAQNLQNGCTAIQMAAVKNDTKKPVINLALPEQLNCRNKQVFLTAVSDSTAALNYEWSTTNGHLIGPVNAAQTSVDQPGDYFFIATNQRNGCSDTLSTLVVIDTVPPIVNAGPDDTLNCLVTSSTLQASVSPPDSIYFYQWLSSDGQILLGANGLSPIVGSSGTYVLVVLNEQNGCLSKDEVILADDTRKPMMQLEAPPIITCARPTIVLDGSNSQQGKNIVYQWITTGGNFTGSTDSLQTAVNAPGIYTFIALDTVNGCSNSVSTIVSANTILPIVEAGTPFTLTCSVTQDNLQAYASAGPDYTYEWTSVDGQFVSGKDGLTPVVNAPGVYYLEVVNTNTGCVNRDSVRVLLESNQPDSLGLQLDSITCKTDLAAISFLQVRGGVGPYQFSIDGGNTYTTEIYFPGLKPDTYALQVMDVNGCTYTERLEVPDAPIPSIHIDPELLKVRRGDSIQLTATIPDTYPLALIDTIIWTPASQVVFSGTDIRAQLSPLAVPLRTTTFAVTIKSKDGCSSTDLVVLQVDNALRVFVPNSFSPNASNPLNRIVTVYSEDNRIANIKWFRIYDRWGSQVHEATNFQPNDPSFGWDGTTQGKTLDPGVYIYRLALDLANGDVLYLSGDTALVK